MCQTSEKLSSKPGSNKSILIHAKNIVLHICQFFTVGETKSTIQTLNKNKFLLFFLLVKNILCEENDFRFVFLNRLSIMISKWFPNMFDMIYWTKWKCIWRALENIVESVSKWSSNDFETSLLSTYFNFFQDF